MYLVVSDSFATPWSVVCQAPLSVELFREEYWSGLPRPPPEDLPNPGIKHMFFVPPVLVGVFFTNSATWVKCQMFIPSLVYQLPLWLS